ncbi:SCL-interrupting locus protein homolog isoform X2 [Gouania willdenowi]|uniref:SCL-interrupting locus protein homolog isoform X2 n=1 Tax=Gouania willdenowi TaxID=441366 RepID=UPI00105645A8|nr:SCL-interrupting locus protein isoform X2 [Gouania willdenowi]
MSVQRRPSSPHPPPPHHPHRASEEPDRRRPPSARRRATPRVRAPQIWIGYLSHLNRYSVSILNSSNYRFVTMDQSRKLLLLLESDPKACSLPLVGLWVSGVTHISNPQVWAWCLRFLFGSTLQDRVFSESGSFLLVLFSSTHRRPQFFQCQIQSPQLDFQLLSSSQCVTLFQGALVDGGTLQCDLRAEGPSGQMDVFRDALMSFSREAGLSVSDQDSGVEDEDLSPRPSPSPHLPPHQARRVQPSVPELSLLIDSSCSTNQAAGHAHSPPVGEKKVPPPSSSSSELRAPPLHSTPNSNLPPPSCCCCCPPITPSSPHHTPPSKPHTSPPPSSNQLSAPPKASPPPSSWSVDSTCCPTARRCEPSGAEVLPSEAYRLLLLQDQQLRLLQAQVQTLLETQKKLQTDNQTSRRTACVSTAMGASLLWAEPQEVQAPPPVSHKLPSSSSSSSSSSLSSSRDTSGPSPPSSPLLSVSMCRPADEPQDFYQNLMTQLTSRLQKENEGEESEMKGEESGRKDLSPCSSPRKKPRPPAETPVLGATVRWLQPLGVDMDPNRKGTAQSASAAAILARLSLSESSANANASVDQSLEANTFMLKHFNDVTVSQLGGSAPSHDSLPSATNMSLATRKYCTRYSLIQEEKEASYSPLTNALNTKPLPQSQLIRELRPKMRLLAADKENREPGRRRNPEGSVGNILDLSRLRQLPKLF